MWDDHPGVIDPADPSWSKQNLYHAGASASTFHVRAYTRDCAPGAKLSGFFIYLMVVRVDEDWPEKQTSLFFRSGTNNSKYPSEISKVRNRNFFD